MNSHEKMLTGLRTPGTTRPTSWRNPRRQIDKTDAEIAGAEAEEQLAVGSGRDHLARAALVHKRDAMHKREVLDSAPATIAPRAAKLVEYERKLADRIEQFRTQKEVMKTTFTAAQAQAQVTESPTGLGDRLSGIGDALRRAGDEVDGMRDLLASGVLTDPFDDRSATRHELQTMRAANAVDDELATLEAETTTAIAPPAERPPGYAMPTASPDRSDPAPASSAPFDPVRVVAGRVDAGVLLVCDHASNTLPPAYGRLGLPAAELERHIAYDIGAAAATEALAEALGAPAVLTTYSRLLIDPNRGPDDPTLVMRLSDGAIVPGNARIGDAEIEHRRVTYWQPYHERVEATLRAMNASGVVPAIVAIHSFTPCWKGVPRPWHVGLLWDNDPRLAKALLHALAAEPDLQPAATKVGDNEPYDGALPDDTIDRHATRHGLANVLIEVRQDLMATGRDARAWGARLARLLAPVLSRPEMHAVTFHPARTGGSRRLAAL